ncbi:exopolysaccharide biosynthesis protein [Clostridia bacterium]|nr:exopolysaccharide biosynthesis protein [Clostridia bacterium]
MNKPKMKTSKIIKRVLWVLLVLFIYVLVAAYTLLHTVVNGPSETVRNTLVLSAKQASATKWVPGLFLDKDLVNKIVDHSQEQVAEEVDVDDFTPPIDNSTDDGTKKPVDPWADAIDGMKYAVVNGATYKAYVLLVHDPSRLYVSTSSDYKSGKGGMRIYDAAVRDGAIAAINGGEFADVNGVGDGSKPIGLTYSNGECVWNDGSIRTFIGIDNNHRLFVANSMTKGEADSIGIRDGVSFQFNNVLIKEEDGKVSAYRADENRGVSQRTAIGQTRDGTFILVVTDGRTASSIGATPNDIIDLMLSYGAVNAGMLDGGSSAMMYYQDYFNKYNIDKDTLDKYQQIGLINKYKAFTTPRTLPTFFMVRPE